MTTQITFLDQAGVDALGEGFEEHTPVTADELADAEARRLAEILRHLATKDVIVNGRDYEGILCVQITTSIDFGWDLYCVYSSGQVALHDCNHPQSYPTFMAFIRDHTAKAQLERAHLRNHR